MKREKKIKKIDKCLDTLAIEKCAYTFAQFKHKTWLRAVGIYHDNWLHS